MIQSLLDNDLYKFTMQQAVLQKYPDAEAEYTFIDRDSSRRYPKAFGDSLRAAVDALGDLKLKDYEWRWLEKNAFFSSGYLQELSGFQLDPSQVQIVITTDEKLDLKVKGPWKSTILWETPLLALISELYYREVDTDWDHDINNYYRLTYNKAADFMAAGARFAEFGTRRRRSYQIQEVALRAIRAAGTGTPKTSTGALTGTSNVHFAERLGIDAAGTMAHEWIMAHEAMYGLKAATPRALESWLDVHGGKYAIALTDTFTVNLFLSQFDAATARKYSGVRHDSGDPFTFCERMISHYYEQGIDPSSKVILFSDGIQLRMAKRILDRTAGRIKVGFGIGTYLTNDFPEGTNSGIVLKMTGLNGKPVVKTTSDPRKATGSPDKIKSIMKEIVQIQYQMGAGGDYSEDTNLINEAP